MRVSFPAPSIKKWISEKRSIFFVQRKVFPLTFAAPYIFSTSYESAGNSPHEAGLSMRMCGGPLR